MNQRQKTILKTVIEEYVSLAEPIGSKLLAKKYDWGISAATIRNDLADLDEEGYLEQPHTSAGRIPTDKGYRFFVQSLKEEKLSDERNFSRMIDSLFDSIREEHQLFREIARTLAEFSGNLGIAAILDEDEIFKFGMPRMVRQPEFDETDEFWRFADDFEMIDEKLMERAEEICEIRRARVFIGRENPLVKNDDLSLVISGYEKSDGKKGVTGIMGPKRMKYNRNISLVDYISKLLSAH